ncbi:MAG: aminotransferase class I/II-fold pyridoxal phosphate-dependent enzyme [Spirochaetia bacterium]|nr:aminotransferase class I/II-fold pyridoxal phosphate-dependent enzyme [Spirochaetia bacterium]
MADYKPKTFEVHGKIEGRIKSGPTTGIYQSTAFEHETAEDIENILSQRKFGYTYSRINNPNLTAFEEKMNLLEKGIGAISLSSGMAAVSAALLSILKTGDEFISGKSLFSGTYSLFTDLFVRFGIKPVFVNSTDIKEIENAVTKKTKLIFVETIGNPRCDVPDLKKISEIAKQAGIPLVLDNTLATPYLFSAKDFGADIIVHSASKYINGSGNAVGGVIIDTGSFEFRNNEKFDDFEKFKKYGALAYLAKTRRQVHTNLGTCLSAQNAFLLSLGLETLSLRMKQHCDNAKALAGFLENHKKVKKVSYSGLKTSEYHETAKSQFYDNFGGLLTFELESKEKAFKFIDNRTFLRNLPNLGDAKSLIVHPASTIYIDFDNDTKEMLGVNDRMIRVSVGIEDSEDIIREFEKILEKI